MGNVRTNDQSICCEVTDWFKGGWNYGCTVMAARFIIDRNGLPTTWGQFEEWVITNGGFLSQEIRMDVKKLWNLEGNVAYSHRWAVGVVPVGRDENGLIWKAESTDLHEDYRIEILNTMK